MFIWRRGEGSQYTYIYANTCGRGGRKSRHINILVPEGGEDNIYICLYARGGVGEGEVYTYICLCEQDSGGRSIYTYIFTWWEEGRRKGQ